MATPQQGFLLSVLAELPSGPIAAGSSMAKQAARLGDVRLQRAQRQDLAGRIVRLQGNRHLQRVLAPPGHHNTERTPTFGTLPGAALREHLAEPVAIIQRLVQGDVTQMSITEAWAAQLTDLELEEQVRIVREQLLTTEVGAAEYEVAQRNLEVLENTARRRLDPRRQLAQRLLDRAAMGGITVAAYVAQLPTVKGAGEFQTQAKQYAQDHRALGLVGGTLREGAAMELSSSLPSLLDSLSTAVEALLADFPEITGPEPIWIPIKTLAIFTHGSRRGLQAGPRAQWIRKQLVPWVEGIAPYLAPAPLVILYACSTAGQPPTGLPFAEELRLALAAELEELHGLEAGVEPVIWGHTTVAHTTANRFLVEFRGGVYSASTDLLEELGRRLASLAIERAQSAGAEFTLTADQRDKVDGRGRQAMQRVLKPTSTSPLDPTQVYIREIAYMGVDRVWRDLSSETTPDLSDVGLEPDATVRLTEGLRTFQARFVNERDRLQEWVSTL